MLVFAYNDCVSFKKPVSLVARQEELVGGFSDVYGHSFCDFSGVTEFWVVRVSHLAKSK